MNVMTALRRKRQTWGARTLTSFVAVWLSLVLQPCVMAFEPAEHGDCPHCPPQMMHHDDHDMASMDLPCAASGDCDQLDEFNYDGRNPEAKPGKFDAKVLALLPPALSLQQSSLPRIAVSVPATDHPSGAAPPLHLLYCVNLS